MSALGNAHRPATPFPCTSRLQAQRALPLWQVDRFEGEVRVGRVVTLSFSATAMSGSQK